VGDLPHKGQGNQSARDGHHKQAGEDDGEKLYISAAACESPHQSFSNYLTVELLALKELSRELAELFGLALPAPRA
jgi:hypothetical protein